MSAPFTPLCENCTQGYVLPGEPLGSMAPNLAYRSLSPSGGNKRAIILLTDIFGLALKNPRIVADRFAERLSCDVWVPDLFFPGSPPLQESDLTHAPDVPNQSQTLFDKIHFGLRILSALPSLLIKYRPGVLVPKTQSFIDELKTKYGYEKIGVIGYCFGGKMGVYLSGIPGAIDSAVIAHPGPLALRDLAAAKVPTSFICAEEDTMFTPSLKAGAEEAWKKRTDGVAYEFVNYPGTVHGFAVRPALSIPQVKEAFEKAFEQSVKWFEKTL